ncbi:hypothetical protein OIO90_001792 [Microbotryomycetes sp. JL221]|nr:hypothetical protein OIO90_001792 [Microbotryomycetes sp. JL221]
MRLTSTLDERDDEPQDLQALVQDWFSTRIAKLSIEPTPILDLELSSLKPPLNSILPKTIKTAVRDVANVLSVKVTSLPRRQWNSTQQRFLNQQLDCIMTASVDKTVKFYTRDTFQLVETFSFETPVLSTVSYPRQCDRLFAAATMDGTVIVVDVVTRQRVVTLKHHSKYVPKLAFSPDGKWFASLGYDKQIVLYQVTETLHCQEQDSDEDDKLATTPQLSFIKRHTINTRTNPEACVFLPDSTFFVWTTRDSNLLHELELPLNQSNKEEDDDEIDWNKRERKYNLNENQQDDWVSFSILHITLHPHLPVLALQTSTDNARILLYPFHSSRRIATVYTTASQSEYTTTARHVWLPCPKLTDRSNVGDSGAALVVNSDDGIVRIVDLNSKVLKRLGAHGQAFVGEDDDDDEEGQESLELRTERARLRRQRDKGSSVIKDVDCWITDRGQLVVVSCGFDKTVKVMTV